MTWGGPWAEFEPANFSSRAELEYSAPSMAEETIWILVLSPPDPDAGLYSGTIGPGGTIIWPTPIDPNPPAGGGVLDDPAPVGLMAAAPLINPAPGLQALPPGDAIPIV